MVTVVCGGFVKEHCLAEDGQAVLFYVPFHHSGDVPIGLLLAPVIDIVAAAFVVGLVGS
jgi:hypothetical protein